MPEREQPDLSGIDGVRNASLGIKGELQRVLGTTDYEAAKEALGKADSLLTWRQAERRSPFPQFYELFEGTATLNQASVTPEARSEMVDKLVTRARDLSPRVRDLYLSLLSEVDKTPYTPQFQMTRRQHEALRDAGDMVILEDPSVSWKVKLNRMQTRIESELKGRAALDRIDERKKEAEERRELPQQDTPPPDSEESKPGMDEMERLKEGETVPAIWEVAPAYGGYFKEQSFDGWDTARNVWTKSSKERTAVATPMESMGFDVKHILSANLPPGQWTRIPIPYKFRLSTLSKTAANVQLAKDENGDMVMLNTGAAAKKVTVGLGEKGPIVDVHTPPKGSLEIPATLSPETQDFLEQLRNSGKTTLQKARSLASFTMRRLEYSNDSSYNALYDGHQDGYIGAIDQFKKADCDVANTYFAALCAQIDIPARHVVGHMVKGKNENGNSAITSGTGHAWTEIWDGATSKWVRIDATPPGDPQQQQEEQQDGESIPGDYPEQEAIRPTDEELQELREQLAAHTERLSYTKEERETSEATGVELKDARQILKEIKEVENKRLPNGERLIDVLASLWALIQESRSVRSSDYTGPVRKREGGERITNIVAHTLGIRSGEIDPASREKEHDSQTEEQIIRAMQVLLVLDGSGSMNQTVDGETKLKIQRQAAYAVFASLYRGEQNMQRSSRITEPLSLFSQAKFFRSSREIVDAKSLSNTFTLLEKVKLWQSLGQIGSDNGDVPALQEYHDQIQEEREDILAQGKIDDTLRVIIACSDGMPDDPAGLHELAEKVGAMNTVLIGAGMTETASQVPIIFDTPHSRGEIVRDINDLPLLVAKDVVIEAIKLFPPKTRGQYQKSIDAILAKFDPVGQSA